MTPGTINADDFGMCHAANAAITRSLTAGVVTSTFVSSYSGWSSALPISDVLHLDPV